MSKITIILLCLGFFAGCAEVKVRKFQSNDKVQGVVFATADPYLLVSYQVKETPAAKKGEAPTLDTVPKYELIYLPGQKYQTWVAGGLGTANGSIKLNPNGTISELGMITDSKIPETIQSIADLIPAVMGVLNTGNGGSNLPPGLYKIDINTESNTVRLLEVTVGIGSANPSPPKGVISE